ncbi:MAG: ferredoxin-thioredoxin reductase catalytic domain-containing protein [Candidatus Thermoplasmatota archaeon]|nr:ferredoxin-thioredoxin reductase catalytic domain-containing protein [Candidatus Thermoplasmatota archaeon]
MTYEPLQEEIEKTYWNIKRDAEANGYRLNPDLEFTKNLVRGLLVNEKRYGYWACPCRLASGKKDEDLDIICPCDYRDPDLGEFGACYCALYVSQEIAEGKKQAQSIPERRLPPGERQKTQIPVGTSAIPKLAYPVWRCKVCGYLCARGEPPEICPICKAKKDRFERFM